MPVYRVNGLLLYTSAIMLQRLAILAISAFVVVSVSSQPNNTSGHELQPAKQGSPAVATPDSQNKQASGQTDQAKPDTNPPKYYKAINPPEWWLVGIAFFTGCGVFWQSWETRKSANAARDSIRLQGSGIQQWVEIRNWRVAVTEPATENSGAQVEIRFDIVNGSDFPLTINDAEIVFYNHTLFGSGENVFLAPKNPYLVTVLFPICIPESRQYESGRFITVRIAGKIPHVGRLGKLIVQSFSGHLIFGKGTETRFIEEVSMVPVEKGTVNRNQHPNQT
jgi:hypothetical protein